jgi:RNA polymerase-associated protein LEO1
VRWSDGTLSLQMGSEIYDITESVERAGAPASGAAADGISQAGMASQTAPAMGSGDAAAAQRARPAQPLQHLFVRMPDQQSYLAEGPIAGTLGLRPTDVQSETHKRLARAVKQQRGARVTQMQFDTHAEDPEAAKARIEKEQRQNSLKEARKKGKGRLARDDEDFSTSRRRHVPLGRSAAALGSDEDEEEEEAVASGGEDVSVSRSSKYGELD